MEALEALQKIGDENCVASVLRGLGEVAQRKGEYKKAASRLRQSLRIHEKLGLDDLVIGLVERFAALALAMGNGERAARLLGASKSQNVNPVLFPTFYRVQRENLTAAIRENLGDQDFDKLFDEGTAMSIQEAIAYAMEETNEK